MSDNDMHHIGLALSANQESKLRNRHKCNCKVSGSGVGTQVFMKKHKLAQVLKKAKAGKGHQLQLDDDEIHHNKIHGSGLFKKLKKTANKVVHSKPFQDVKKQAIGAAENLGKDVIKEGLEAAGVPPGISDAAGKAAAHSAAKAVDKSTGGRLSLHRGVRRLKETKKQMGMGFGKKLGHFTEKHTLGGMAYDHIKGGKFSFKHAGKQIKHTVNHNHIGRQLKNTGQTILADPIAQDVAATAVGMTLAENPLAGAAAGAATKQAMQHASGKGLFAQARGSGLYGRGLMAGGAVGPELTNITNVGAGGTFLARRHPALASVHSGAYFNRGPQLLTGGGLYGRGMYL